MLFTTHVATGALIGTVLRRPVPAGLVGVASHFGMDSLPHWGTEDEQTFLRIARVDGLTGLAVGALLCWLAPPERRAAVLAGISGAAGPDLNKPARELLDLRLFPRPVDRVHKQVQRGKEAPHRLPRGVLVAATLTGLAVSVVRR